MRTTTDNSDTQVCSCSEEYHGWHLYPFINFPRKFIIYSQETVILFELHREEENTLLPPLISGSSINPKRLLIGRGDIIICHLKDGMHRLDVLAKCLFSLSIWFFGGEFADKVIHAT